MAEDKNRSDEKPRMAGPDADADNAATAPVNPAEEKTEPAVPTLDVSTFATRAVNGFVWGTGRRKNAVARVRIRPGKGQFMVNNREADKFFCLDRYRKGIRAPLEATKTAGEIDVMVTVSGGGITGQAGAIVLGLARALKSCDPAFESALRTQNLLTRDSREVERKKYGQSGARRRFQFSKR